MTTILGIDTATSGCSAALWRDGAVLARRAAEMPRGQSEALLPMIREVMAEAGAGFGDLDLFAVTVGPGAFTGLRIGLSAARGMALATGIPCFGLTTFEVLLRSARDAGLSGPVVVALDAKRADLYVQAFDAEDEATTPPGAVLPEDLPGFLPETQGTAAVVGDAAGIALEALSAAGRDARKGNAPTLPDAAVIAGLAGERWLPGTSVPVPEPLYLRPPDAVKPVNGGRVR